MKKRNRIDWEAEERKTEQVRMRGFRTSVLSFFVAAMFLVGASQMNKNISIYPYLIMTGCIFAAVVVLVLTLRRSSLKNKDDKDER